MTKSNFNAKSVALALACLGVLTMHCQFSAAQAATSNVGSTSTFKDPAYVVYEVADAAVDDDDDDDDDDAKLEAVEIFTKTAMRELEKLIQSDDKESLSITAYLLAEAAKGDDDTKIDNLAYAIDRIYRDALLRTVSRTLVRYDAEELLESRKNVRFVAVTFSREVLKGLEEDFEDYYSSKPRIADSDYNALFLKSCLEELFTSKAREISEKAGVVSLLEHKMVAKALAFLLVRFSDDDEIDVEDKDIVAFTMNTVVKTTIESDDDDDDDDDD